MFYNLNNRKIQFNKKGFLSQINFRRKSEYKNLRRSLIFIFKIGIVNNQQSGKFYRKSDWAVGIVPSWITVYFLWGFNRRERIKVLWSYKWISNVFKTQKQKPSKRNHHKERHNIVDVVFPRIKLKRREETLSFV